MNKETDYSVFLARLERKNLSSDQILSRAKGWTEYDPYVSIQEVKAGEKVIPLIIGKHALMRMDQRMLWRIGKPVEFVMNMVGTKTIRALMKYPVKLREGDLRPGNDLEFDSVAIVKDDVPYAPIFEAGKNYIYLKTVVPAENLRLYEKTRKMKVFNDGHYEWVTQEGMKNKIKSRFCA